MVCLCGWVGYIIGADDERDIGAGELVTCFPGDAVVAYIPAGGDRASFEPPFSPCVEWERFKVETEYICVA